MTMIIIFELIAVGPHEKLILRFSATSVWMLLSERRGTSVNPTSFKAPAQGAACSPNVLKQRTARRVGDRPTQRLRCHFCPGGCIEAGLVSELDEFTE